MKMQYGFDDKVPAGKAVPWALQYVFTIFTGSMTGSIMLASGAGRNKIAVVGSIGNSQQSVILSGMGTANTQLASHDQTKILQVGAIRGRYNEE